MTSDFATCRLGEGGPRRKSRVAPRYRKDGYDAAFDDRTLWLDAVWHQGVVTLVCPRLNNLAGVFRSGALALDGVPARPRVRHFYRHSLVQMRAPELPARVTLEVAGTRHDSAVSVTDPARFRGRNVIVTMSRDNDLVWIEDFARFHAETQGADAIILVDNASRGYGRAEIEQALARTGLDALVLRTDLPFGPRGRAPHANTELFLQTCVLNALRLRHLSEARAVLCCDIDELILSRRAPTVFDATWQSIFGFTRFEGEWRHAPTPAQGITVRHADHVLVRSGGRPSPAKWCIRPTGPLGELQWRPHVLEGFAFNWLFLSRAFTYHHCRQITTGWKRDPHRDDTAQLVPAEPAAVLARGRRRVAPRPAAAVRAGWNAALRRGGEVLSRRFFALRPASQVVSLLILSCLGIVLEEAIDDDPAQQEIDAILAILDATPQIDQMEATLDVWF
ncbi:hypothetical protein [Roseivivax isoporae]|uniref:Glycosyl transferase family 2 n=1 Tax=Roseivivax isoporae LMG 25204 TaxID=1449351 RepID=X7F8E0_9RHOB|nr:hypothetical protein [Roseivivax isoporae]ETX29172.1 hypothetical protein RISW2_02600 [Roseivivax isoporae LMG 25204]